MANWIRPPGMTVHIDASPPDPNSPPQYPDDGYPAVIQDARHGYHRETREEIEAFWLEYLIGHRIELKLDDREVVPYINRARWLYDCPACNAGNWCWDRMVHGCCFDCGALVKLMWPAPLVRSQAIRLLAVRPIVNANWNVHKGETVAELEVENRWMLNEPSVEKNGLVVPIGLDVPEALERYVDPKVA